MGFTNYYWRKFLVSKYLILLLALLSMLLIFPLMEDQLGGKFLFAIYFLFVLVGMFYSLKGKKGVFIFLAIGLVALLTNLAVISFKQIHLVSQVFSILFYLYSIVLFCKDIYAKEEVTQDLLIGSICVYLLIGITFGQIYILIQSININSIIHQASNFPINKSIDFYYFSFITLATVGFGDIIAHTPFAKSCVMLEGMVGIFYIAILVARMVSIFSR